MVQKPLARAEQGKQVDKPLAYMQQSQLVQKPLVEKPLVEMKQGPQPPLVGATQSLHLALDAVPKAHVELGTGRTPPSPPEEQVRVQ